MCAKKTPTTPTKQNAVTGVAKSPVKKVVAPKQTTKAKASADESTAKSNIISAIAKDVKANLDAKKSELKAPATSNKKASKTISSETKASTHNKGSIKQTQNVKDTKKINSRDSSADNAKGKKQPINGKTNKAKATDSDRDKLGENKSNHIRDNKITGKSDEVKSKSNPTNEQCNKLEKSSSSLSLKSNGESDNAIKDKEKLIKKAGDKSRPAVSSPIPRKISNNKISDESCKKSADKPKSSSKIAKKASKEKESKIKISNELKNLGIEMSKSNSSLAVVIQEGLMSSGVKTSICEMVKTKARICSNSNSGGKCQNSQAKKNSEFRKTQDKVLKEGEAKVSEAVEGKKTSEQFKLIDAPDKKITQAPIKITESDAKLVVASKNKISALVNAKNKIKSLVEPKKCEDVSKSNELEPSKPAKRKYVKKKKVEDAADSVKNSSTASESDARNNAKIDQNKAACANISDGKNSEIKSTSKADESMQEISAVGRKDKIEASTACESTAKPTLNKPKTLSKVKNQEGSKVKKTVQSLSCDGKSIGVKVDMPTAAGKIKRKYVKKIKSVQAEGGEKMKEKPLKFDVEKIKPIKVERDKSNESKKASAESQRNGLIEKKLKSITTPLKEDVKKSQEKLSKPVTPKKDLSKVESQDKVAKSKTLKCKTSEKKSNEKQPKASPKKQNMEVKLEKDPLEINSSDSENSSNSSDSDSELTDGTFKKPSKLSIQRNLRNKKHKQVACKRTRVASLNAIARVHFLYENEARSTLEANIAKAIKNSLADGSSDDEDESEAVDLTSKR